MSEAAWLLAIARNVCLTRADARRRRDRAEVTEDPQLLDELLAAHDADEGVSAEVQAAFGRLPERQRQALFLREWQECSYAEIAQTLGTSEGAVETLLFRARRTLARELGASRRRLGDLAGLLGWLRTAVGTTASKLAIGAAVVAATAVGTEVAASPHARPVSGERRVPVVAPARSVERPSASHHPAAARLRRRAPLRKQVASKPAPRPPARRVRSAVPPPAPAPTAPSAAAATSPIAAPTAAAGAPARVDPTPQTATAAPASASSAPTTTTTAVTSTTSAVANTVTTATDAVSSAVDSVAQTVSNAAPAAAPAANAAAQTVDGAAQTVNNAAQTVGNAVQSVGTTVSNLLPGH